MRVGLRALMVSAVVVASACTPAPLAQSSPSIVTLTPSASVGGEASAAPAQPVTIEAGDAAGSTEAVPWADNSVKATGSDGSSYELDIPPFALTKPTTISLRPLATATIPGATLLAGVELEPTGLQLQVPATLTITPAERFDRASAMGLTYEGSTSGTARLGDTVGGAPATSLAITVAHFSGGMAVATDTTGESLWLQQGTFNDSTIDGRQAHAEYAIDVLDWSEQQGRIDHDSAESSRQYWRQQWWEAEQDRLDTEMNGTVQAGDINQSQTVIDQATEMVRIGREIGENGDVAAAEAAIDRSIQLLATYAQNTVDHLNADAAFQAKLDAGLVTNIDDVLAVAGTLEALARSIDALDPATSARVVAAAQEWVKRLVQGILDHCAEHGPIDTATLIGLLKTAQSTGLPYDDSTFDKCRHNAYLITASTTQQFAQTFNHTPKLHAQFDVLVQRTGANTYEGTGTLESDMVGGEAATGLCATEQHYQTPITVTATVTGNQMLVNIAPPPVNYPVTCDEVIYYHFLAPGGFDTGNIEDRLVVTAVSGDPATGYVFDGSHLDYDCRPDVNPNTPEYGSIVTCTWTVDVSFPPAPT